MSIETLEEKDLLLTVEEFAIVLFSNTNTPPLSEEEIKIYEQLSTEALLTQLPNIPIPTKATYVFVTEDIIPEQKFRLLTSYESYLVAYIIVDVIKRDRLDSFLSMYESELIAYYHQKHRHLMRSSQWKHYEILSKCYYNTYSAYQKRKKLEILIDELGELINRLETKDYIEDPLIEAVAAVAVLGMIPINFTRRTVKGQLIYQKISAIWWEYEEENKNKETSIYRFHFKVIEAYKAISDIIASGDKKIRQLAIETKAKKQKLDESPTDQEDNDNDDNLEEDS